MHIAIIGSGSAAFAAAIHAVENGAKVTMIESGTIGGTCVNVGCVPSKIFIRAAHVAHVQQSHPFSGLSKFATLIQRKALLLQQQTRVDELRRAKYENILSSNSNIIFIKGIALFKGKNMLSVETSSGERIVEADRILIATGSSAFIPPIDGLHNTPYWTSTEALQCEALPQHLVVLGSSIIAVELAQAFLRLGSKVTLLARSRLLSKEDPEIGVALKQIFEKEGMQVLVDTVPEKISYMNQKFTIDIKGAKEAIEADRLLVATGRKANVQKLALERAGVKVNSEGHILINEYMQTNVDTIYAAGDCTNQPQYVYVAAAAGTRASVNMLGGQAALDLSIVPSVIFTEPQIATVGLNEDQAKKLKINAESRTLTLDNVPRALVNFDCQGFVKLVAEKTTGRILGAQILAAEAGEIIQTMAIAIRKKMTINELSSQLFPYLTMVESLKLCAQIFKKDVKKLSCCADSFVAEEYTDGSSERLKNDRGNYSSVLPMWTSILSEQQRSAVAQDEGNSHKSSECCSRKPKSQASRNALVKYGVATAAVTGLFFIACRFFGKREINVGGGLKPTAKPF